MLDKKPKQTENQIQSAIREYLQYNGWFVIRNQQSLGSLKGLADLTAIRNGKVLWIEVKTPKGRLSEWQTKFKAEIEAHGGIYLEARSVEDVEQFLYGKCGNNL